MNNVIPVTVIITTYDPDGSRAPIAEQTIKSFSENLKYPNLRWIISDDGSPNHGEFMAKLKVYVPDAEIINVNRGGVGKSKNTALRKAFEVSPIIFLSEDDWWLPEPLDMLPYVQRMLDNPDIGLIRFGYIGGTTLEAYYRGYTPFETFWEFKQGSDVYAYSGQCSLRSEIWYKTVGYHQEFCTPGEEEIAMCIAYNATPNAPKILWDARFGTTLNAGPFKNIGMGNSLNGIMPDAR